MRERGNPDGNQKEGVLREAEREEKKKSNGSKEKTNKGSKEEGTLTLKGQKEEITLPVVEGIKRLIRGLEEKEKLTFLEELLKFKEESLELYSKGGRKEVLRIQLEEIEAIRNFIKSRKSS